MATFVYERVDAKDIALLEQAEKASFRPSGVSPFRDGEIVKVVGGGYVCTNKATDKQNFFPVLYVKVGDSEIETELWVSMLAKQPYDARKKQLVPFEDEAKNLNQKVVNANLITASNKVVLDKVLAMLKSGNTFKKLLVKRVRYSSIVKGEMKDTLEFCQFIIK